MVFIPRAQPLCRPVTLPMTLRGETEGILSFLPSIPVKSFIIQLPDYFKKLTRLWFSSAFVCVCLSEGERVSEKVAQLAVGCTLWLLGSPSLPPSPHLSYTHFLQLFSVTFIWILLNFQWRQTPSSFFLIPLLLLCTVVFVSFLLSVTSAVNRVHEFVSVSVLWSVCEWKAECQRSGLRPSWVVLTNRQGSREAARKCL